MEFLDGVTYDGCVLLHPMADSLTPAERSHRMSLIRSRDTKPELLLRRALHATGARYRLHRKDLPGKPDLVFARSRTVVFVNGCFWHGHRCATGHIPKSNSEFWRTKILTNRNRDARNIRYLRQAGWKVVVVWECETTTKVLPATLGRLLEVLDERRQLRTGPVSVISSTPPHAVSSKRRLTLDA